MELINFELDAISSTEPLDEIVQQRCLVTVRDFISKSHTRSEIYNFQIRINLQGKQLIIRNLIFVPLVPPSENFIPKSPYWLNWIQN